ncbi:MAG: helix-turn-helix domain-containing protein, partial [bacterium]|nr:helix-turn-helix domain-containing protein [bacterium]
FRKILDLGSSYDSGIWVMKEDPAGELWVGTYSRGLFHVSAKGVINYTTKNGLLSNRVKSIFFDSRGNHWFGGNKGLNRFGDGVFSNYTTKDGLSANGVYHIHEDSHNNLWLGTMSGITILENGRTDRQNISTYCAGNGVFDIYEDPEDQTGNTFWIGTFRSGLIRFKNRQAVFCTVGEGMGSNNIYQVVEDSKKNLLLSSNDGIMKVSKQNLNDFADGKTDKIKCTFFGTSDGMLSEQCTMASTNSIIKTGDEYWFATEKGIAVLPDGDMKLNKVPPPIVIEQIHFNGKSLTIADSGKTFKGIAHIRFQFTAPTFKSPNKASLYYRLEGYDNKRHKVASLQERVASYRHLPPGTYTFRVTATNSDGIGNSEGGTFTFTLGLYFYRTLWFRILLVLLLPALVAASYFGIRRFLYLRKINGKYKNSALNPEKTEKILKKLNYLLDIKKVYKDDEITLQSLAAKLKINSRYLSQAVNEQLGRNFSDLINDYRIRDAKRILADPENVETSGRIGSLLDVAFEVGFSSKAAFNRSFKKYTGKTPTEYKKNI